MKLKMKKCIWLVMALGWWGVLYPDLCLVRDTVTVVCRTEEERSVYGEQPGGSELYYQILSAKPEQIKIKSKLLETISDYFEKGKEE